MTAFVGRPFGRRFLPLPFVAASSQCERPARRAEARRQPERLPHHDR